MDEDIKEEENDPVDAKEDRSSSSGIGLWETL